MALTLMALAMALKILKINIQKNSKRIIELISSNNRITRKQIADELSIIVRQVQRIINKFDSVEFVGRGMNGCWVIKD